MRVSSIRARFRQLAESQALSTDLSRATRSTLGFMLPLILVPLLKLPVSATYVALAAQSISTIDIRGAYSLRIALLVAATFILAIYGALGAFFAGQLFIAIGLTGLLTLATGFWRHWSPDYGASISISALLMLFLTLAGQPGVASAETVVKAILCGGLLAILLHTLYWPFRPQHPLRRTVADTWLAAANLFAALAPVETAKAADRHTRVVDAENALHGAIDKAALLIIQATGKKTSLLLGQLEALNLCAARLAVSVDTFNTALEGCMSGDDMAHLAPAFDPVLTALTNTARSIALTVVSRQPSHLAIARVRLRRTAGLLNVLRTRIRDEPNLSAFRVQLEQILAQIEGQWPSLIAAVQKTVERGEERAAFSVELFDLNTWMLRPLAASLNLSPAVDPALLRYVLRLTVLTIGGVAAFIGLNLPHGYWLPFTMVVVLQPDFGATRQRAAQRVAGTLAGSCAATALLWLHPPHALILGAIAICVFSYAYILRRSYGHAIFFVTIFVVLLLEGAGGGQPHVALERVLATCGGGLLAFAAAAIFWPLWERDRFPAILAKAFRANADYLGHLTRPAVTADQPATSKSLEKTKRIVERANAEVFASLRRMLGDPRNRREGVEQCAALANGNQRLTRILNVIFLQTASISGVQTEAIRDFCSEAGKLLLALADETALRKMDTPVLIQLAKALETSLPKNQPDKAPNLDRDWLFFQCGRAATELSAMALAAEGDLRLATPA